MAEEQTQPVGRWVIWPEYRFLTEDKARMALGDAIANEEVDIEEDAPLKAGDENALPFDEVCKILDLNGIFTFSRNDNPKDQTMREQAYWEAQEQAAEREP